MARAPIRNIGGPAAIQPSAAPVNTFMAAPQATSSPLNALAQGLSSVDRGLTGFLKKRQDERDKDDAIRGEAAFNANNQQGWASGVADGSIPANSSPPFMESYKRQQGNLAGIQLREKFRVAFQGWEGRDSNDPEAFQSFVSEFVAGNVSTTDPDILRGINPHVSALIAGGYEQHTKEASARVYNDSLATNAAVISEDIDAANSEGLASKKGTNYDAMWSRIISVREGALATGTRREDMDAQIVKTIASKAIETGDPSILKLLDRKLPGSKFKISSMPQYRDVKAKALAALETESRQREVDSSRRQKAIDKKRKDELTVGITRAIAKDPNVPISEEVLREYEKYVPNGRTKIAETRKKLLNGDASLERPSELLKVSEIIRRGGTEADIDRAVAEGVITTPGTYNRMLDRLDKYREQSKKGGGSVLRGQTSKRYLSAIKSRTAEDGQLDPFGVKGMSDAGMQASQDFDEMVMDWQAANPDATLMEREKAINEIGRTILERIDTDEKTYTAPPVAQKEPTTEKAPEVITNEPTSGMRPFNADEALTNPDGTKSTERTYTVPLGDGTFVNIPSLWKDPNGKTIDLGTDQEAMKKAALEYEKSNGETFQRYPHMGAAVEAAEKRSQDGGAGAGPQKQSLDDQIQEVDQKKADSQFATKKHPPILTDLPESFQTKIKSMAQRKGITPEEMTVKIWQKLQDKVGGNKDLNKELEAPKPTGKDSLEGSIGEDNLNVPREIRKQLNDSLADDVLATPEVNTVTKKSYSKATAPSGPLLNLLGKAEGTDRGRGYNETLSYGAFTNGDVELTSMSINQVLAVQAKMLKHPKNKWNSSAVGRYQIVSKTMRRLVKNMGLTGNEKFNAQMQDQMAIELLKGRGYDKWKAGKITTDAFINNLSKEWASLPTTKNKGYYGGQRSAVDVSNLRGILHSLKDDSEYVGLDNQGPSKNSFGKISIVATNGRNPDLKRVKKPVLTKFSQLQDLLGEQIPLNSGFRSPKRNAKAGGARKSQHMHGNAIDLNVRSWSKAKRNKLIREASRLGFTGIGVYNNSIHLDLGGRRYWGPTYKSASLPSWAKAEINAHMKRS